MNFDQALEELHIGNSVRRLRWLQPSTVSLGINPYGDIGVYVTYPLNPFTGRPNQGSQLPYSFSDEDIAANDWIVV